MEPPTKKQKNKKRSDMSRWSNKTNQNRKSKLSGHEHGLNMSVCVSVCKSEVTSDPHDCFSSFSRYSFVYLYANLYAYLKSRIHLFN